MIDWTLLLTPLALLAIVLLFIFVGCQLLFGVDVEEPPENTGTTTGEEPEFIKIEIQLSAGCDAIALQINVILTSDITNEQAILPVTMVPSDATGFGTTDLHITLADEGHVTCAVDITPVMGEKPPFQTAMHDKNKDELVAPFTITCQEGGFELA